MLREIKSINELKIFRRAEPYIGLIVFFTAVVVGFMTYGFNMSNGYVNGDGLTYGIYYEAGIWDIGQGRWALPLFDGRFVTSWFEGLMSIAALSLSSVVIVKFFEIGSIPIGMLISMFVASQTHFAQWQGSPYILFPYSVGFLVSVVAAYEMWKGMFDRSLISVAISVLLSALSLGIYQAYLSIAILMLYIRLLLEVMRGISWRRVARVILSMVCALLSIGIVYLFCMKASMMVYHAGPVSARGWGGLLQGDVELFRDPLGTIKSVYDIFCHLLVLDGLIDFSKGHKIAYIVLLLSNVYLFFRWMLDTKGIRPFVVGVGFCLVPMIVMMVRLLTDTVIPWSMYPAIIFIPILGILFGSKVETCPKSSIGVQWLVAFCALYLVGESIYIANIDYANLQRRNMKMQAVCIRLLDRIETYEGYEVGMPVVFVGALQDTYPNPLTLYERKLKGYEAYIMDWLPYRNATFMYVQYITDYLGVELRTPDDHADIITKISLTEEFEQIPSFPAMDCVYEYDGVLVVKLSDV